MGLNNHVSPLGYKVAKLMKRYPLPGCDSIEEWLMAVAFLRDFCIVRLPRQFNERELIPGIDDLSNADLLLSKLMRDDPIDQKAALFIVERASFSRDDIEAILASARMPDSEDISKQFSIASQRLLSALEQNK